MSWLLYLSVSSAAIAAAPTDAELLAYIKGRSTLQRITPTRVDMAAQVISRCNIDAVLLKPGEIPVENPHLKAKFHTYANAPAVLPVFDPWGRFPEGSLLVKEKFSETGETQLFTGMWKREQGYFPETGDWEFFTVDATAGRIAERGRLPKCAACHEEMVKGDHVSRDYIIPAQITDGRIILHSSGATTHGEKLRYEEPEKKNTLGFWVDPADWAEWEFNVTRPGTFDIHLWQGCGPGSGGSEVSITTAGQTAGFVVEETGHFQNFKERVVGRVRFEKTGPQKLELRALKKPGAAVMDVRLIVLTPVKQE
ncbi:hypothetical protein JIN84_16800 [Luteolibacter yonseiensis]|uniref:DUF5077 domain-containing protein n=2 Tax=Luteolibacter yonseiensis TaxID=1144680 RepID=A0A934V8I1_9BACT|nr:hypothetical protein [Luteolibacter yonseiensis]MBK1817282.1 hypothetical protein [Luteolibacter yonseiensis]